MRILIKILLILSIVVGVGMWGKFARRAVFTVADGMSFLSEISYTLPEVWIEKGLLGDQLLIVSSELDHGIEANVSIGPLYGHSVDEAVENMLSRKKREYSNFTTTETGFFTVSEEVAGKKIVSKRTNNQGIPLVYFQYAMPDKLDVFSLSCICAEASRERYEPIFNCVAKSVRRKGNEK